MINAVGKKPGFDPDCVRRAGIASALLRQPAARVTIEKFAGFFRLLLDELQFDISTHDSVTRITLVESQPLGDRRVLALELMLMLVQGVASWLIQRRISFLRIALVYPAPLHAADYIDLYPGPACFGQRVTALHLSSKFLQEPIRQDKRSLAAIARLTTSGAPVAAIGAGLGFEDSTAFNRAFKAWTGSTPSAYRKRPMATWSA